MIKTLLAIQFLMKLKARKPIYKLKKKEKKVMPDRLVVVKKGRTK